MGDRETSVSFSYFPIYEGGPFYISPKKENEQL